MATQPFYQPISKRSIVIVVRKQNLHIAIHISILRILILDLPQLQLPRHASISSNCSPLRHPAVLLGGVPWWWRTPLAATAVVASRVLVPAHLCIVRAASLGSAGQALSPCVRGLAEEVVAVEHCGCCYALCRRASSG